MSFVAEDTPSTRRGRVKGARGASGRAFSAEGQNRGPASAGVSVDSADYACEVLERLLHILVLTGHSPRTLATDFRRISLKFKEPSKRWDPARLGFLAALPHVIALWHSDPQYQGRRGKPASLALGRGSPSLRSLIKRVLPQEDPRQVLRALLHMRGVRRKGAGYVPTGRHLSYRDDSGRVYSLSVLQRMLRTVERNIEGTQKTIFERSAVNPNFPVRALGTFHRRFEPRAAGFLWDSDTELRRYETEHPGGARTRLGIEIFVFEEPLPQTPAKGAVRRTSRRAVPRVRRIQRKRV